MKSPNKETIYDPYNQLKLDDSLTFEQLVDNVKNRVKRMPKDAKHNITKHPVKTIRPAIAVSIVLIGLASIDVNTDTTDYPQQDTQQSQQTNNDHGSIPDPHKALKLDNQR